MVIPAAHRHTGSPNPFRLDESDAYRRWRDAKLDAYPSRPEELIVELRNPLALTPGEHAAMLSRLRKTNMVIYTCRGADIADSAAVPATAPGVALPPASMRSPDTTPPPPSLESKEIPRSIGAQFGLTHLDDNLLADEDAISSLRVMPEKSGRGYIPYSNQRLLWHTDGYYNRTEQSVRAFVLHCVTPAAEGGENCLLDPEIAYLRLRDEEPDYIRALMAPDAMTIPANEESGEARAAVSGPVFTIDPRSGALHMRYTARTRSIQWHDDEATRAAVSRLAEILAETSRHHIRHRLEAGQGLLCNNVLHNRTAFADDMDSGRVRLLYRARYHERIRGTSLGEAWR